MRESDFRLLAGAELLRAYRPAPDASVKVFCTRCGSSLFGGSWPDGPEVSIRFGSLDGDPGIRPQAHTFVGSMAPFGERLADAQPADRRMERAVLGSEPAEPAPPRVVGAVPAEHPMHVVEKTQGELDVADGGPPP